MTPKGKGKDEDATAGAPEKTESKDATATPDAVQAKAKAHDPEGVQAPVPGQDAPADEPGRGGSVSYDRPPGSDVVMTGTPNQNAASMVRTEELHAADLIVRGGTTPQVAYPQVLPREQQEENAAEMARHAAANASGAEDGIATVYPQVAGPTNLALTQAEVLAQIDDGALDARGRLAGTYLDDLQAEEEQRRRERIEGFASSPESRAAAARVRELATSPAVAAADLGRRPDQRALVDPRRHTGQGDPNDPIRRAREVTDAERNKPAGARA